MQQHTRAGATILEITAALTVLAIVMGAVLPPLRTLRDRASVRSATVDVVAALTLARHTAIAEGRAVATRFDTAAAQVVVAAGRDTLAVRPLRRMHGVSLDANRDSIAYNPIGLGYGAANVRITLTRGAAQDTIFLSRLGRVRH